MWTRTLIAACCIGVTAAAQVEPPRLRSGAAPALPAPATTAGGGQVFVELSIGPSGAVTGVSPLRTTPPFTALVEQAVRRWRFRPATDGGNGVASRVLVASHFRAPTLVAPTPGEPPRDVAPASDAVPFPLSTVEPPYPPQALSSGVVMIEALVDDRGEVASATVVRSVAPFNAAAVEAARQWRFRPARHAGRAVPAYVYVIFGFPQPVTARRP